MKFHKALFLLIFLAACGSKEDSLNTSKKYFDIRGYFEKEAERLQLQNPTIKKLVSQNSESEQKEIKITDWKTEFELFTESDINKPAWRNSYTLVKTEGKTEYLSTDNELRTKEIRISLSANGAVKQISIFNKTSNPLYTSIEELFYFPDSLYGITKHQNVQIIGKNSYSVLAKF